METKKVEAYIGYLNHQWDTKIVEIPIGTPNSEFLCAVEDAVLTSFNSKQRKVSEIAFVGIYNDNLVVD